MLFNSLHFLVFFPITVAFYYILPTRFRWLLLFLASCYFYMSFVPAYILILFVIILIDYTAARLIEKANAPVKKIYLVVSIVANLLLLGYFKYFNFVNDNLASLFQVFGASYEKSTLSILLPIGLSFHTLQSMGYTIEVFRGRQKAEKHLGYFANYVLFFPQMVAGPIERYETLGTELRKEQVFTYQNFVNGLRLMLAGFVLKMCVADNLAPHVNLVYDAPQNFARYDICIAMLLFSFQIYADFSGYSLIASGCALVLGIRIMDNFKTPYLSKSIAEFWTRWHISLSTWFRDYLYIPLGGSRVQYLRWAFNILVVFMVSGLWHGASWTFVIWGLLHALARILEDVPGKLGLNAAQSGGQVVNVFRTLRTFAVVTVIWVFFRAETFEKALTVLKGAFGTNTNAASGISYQNVLLAIALLVCSEVLLYNTRIDSKINGRPLLVRWLIYSALLFCLLAMAGTQKYTFIYFQF